MAKVDCSGLDEGPERILGGGTGMYEVILDARVCFWIENSAMGPSGVWTLTAKPLKQGILREAGVVLRRCEDGHTTWLQCSSLG